MPKKRKYDPAIPATYEGQTDKQMAREYKRLRETANKRLNRLEAAGFTQEQIYQLNRGRFPAWTKIETKQEKAAYLRDLQMFIASSKSTITGVKKAVQETITNLRGAGYNFITDYKSLREFVDFMDYSRAISKGHQIGSPTTAEQYRIWKEEGKTPEEIREEFKQWRGKKQTQRERALRLAKTAQQILNGE